MPVLSALVLADRHPPTRFVDTVREAEQAGVRTVWTYDHLSWGGLRTSPWYAAVPLLAAAAVATTRVRLGTQVATPNYRHPVPFAKEVMTLDQLSGGRFDLGIGAGVTDGDALVTGEPPRTTRAQAERFAEWTDLLDELLRNEVVTHEGPTFSAIEARMAPGCATLPRVPFTVAASGKRAMAVAAEHGQSWVTYGTFPYDIPAEQWYETLARQSRNLDDALAAAGRKPGEVRRIVQLAFSVTWPFESAERYRDVLGRLDGLGFDEFSVHWPREDGRGMPATALDFVVDAHAHDPAGAPVTSDALGGAAA